MKRIVNPKSLTLVSEIDHKALHSLILNKISNEFAEMVSSCYYPKIAQIEKDLYHMTNSNEKELREYSKLRYAGKEKFKLLHDPLTTLMILITQDFLQNKDLAAAEATFHLYALRQYTNLMHRYTTPPGSRQSVCNPDAFRQAYEQLSKNHMFAKQKTIPNSILYYSRAIFKIYLPALMKNDPDGIWRMIYAIRTRINQSMRSFFNKYYESIKMGQMSKSEKDEKRGEYDQSHESKLKGFISKIVTDMCVYQKVDSDAVISASSLIKFNKRLSEEYAKKLGNPKYSEKLEHALYLLLRDVKDVSVIKTTDFIDYVQKLMSIKVTKQQVYFKKLISEIHYDIIVSLKLETWFDGLSIQSKSISRNFIAYYIAFYLRDYV